MTLDRVPIGGALAAAVHALPAGWTKAWAALGLTCACLWIGLGGGGALWLAAALLAALAARGALWRAALGLTGTGPGGLQIGRIEGRLAQVWALSALFLAVLASLALVVLLAAAYAVASAGAGFDARQVASWAPAITGRGRWVLGAVGFAILAAWAAAAARISLAEAATLSLGRIQVLSTWAPTRGLTLRLLILQIAVAVPPLAAFWARPGAASPAVEALALGALWLPMSVGLMAYVWRRIAPEAA